MKGYTQIGLLTGMIILVFQVFLMKFGVQSRPIIGLQYLILLLGIFTAIYLYDKENKLVILDLFMIGIRTMSNAVIILVLGTLLFYFVFPHPEDTKITQLLMMVVFPFGMSGVLSSFVSAIIVNKLLQKT